MIERSLVIDIDDPVDTLDFADLADRLAAMTDAQSRTGLASAEQTSRHLASLMDALTRVRESIDPTTVLESAGRELCAAAVFDRVMASRVCGSTWSPLSLCARGADGRVVTDVDENGAGVHGVVISLASPLIEAEVVRRRLPALVRDARAEPRAHRLLVECGMENYVVGPIVAGGTVIGLLHADAVGGGRVLTDLDRDFIRLFADGVALVYERADLAERSRRQRQAVAEVCAASQRLLVEDAWPAGFARRTVTTPPQEESRTLPAPGHRRMPDGVRRDAGRLSRLTAREREVLALLASGATNTQLADQLTVAESTVKSHVKHILHKLGAGNRAAAIACYHRESREDERRRR